MFHVVLVAPEIAPNTGNIIRLCANTGAHLHLVEPLGFSMDHGRLRRAGLDYHELVNVELHAAYSALDVPGRRFGFTTKAATRYDEVCYEDGDVFVFGAERDGLPDEVLATRCHALYLPMMAGNRSLNLANAVAVVLYEAWRQVGFAGAAKGAKSSARSGLTSETPGSEPFDR